jgi:PadR family transcriptional regulator PadR
MTNSNRADLEQWEEVYKRGLLTFWILLLLDEREMYAYEMQPALARISQQTIDVDENSIYRALRRFAEAGFVQSSLRDSESGPSRRYFRLTSLGRSLLGDFIERNLMVFSSPDILARMRVVLDTRNQSGEKTDG